MIIVIIVIAIIVIALVVFFYLSKYLGDSYDKISFKESIDLTELPVITFLIGDKKCNFLLDTGATISVINSEILSEFAHEDIPIKGTLYGLEGNVKPVNYVSMNLVYKNTEYTDKFQVTDLSAAFGSVKQESGVTLHGILGNQFFQKYKYVLDFNELIAYSKK